MVLGCPYKRPICCGSLYSACRTRLKTIDVDIEWWHLSCWQASCLADRPLFRSCVGRFHFPHIKFSLAGCAKKMWCILQRPESRQQAKRKIRSVPELSHCAESMGFRMKSRSYPQSNYTYGKSRTYHTYEAKQDACAPLVKEYLCSGGSTSYIVL